MEMPPAMEVMNRSEQGQGIPLTPEDYDKLKEVWQDTTALLGPQYAAPASVR